MTGETTPNRPGRASEDPTPATTRWPHAGHVGTRAVVRHRLAERERGPHGERLTDVIGRLLGFDEHEVRLLTRDGDEVTVPRARIVAAKPLPPAPERHAKRGHGPDQAPRDDEGP